MKNRKMYTKMEEIADPGHTAIVVWDVQNGLVDRIFNREAFLQNLKTFLKAGRNRDMPVVYSKITPLPTEYESPARILMMMKRFGVDSPEKIPPFMEKGTPEAEIPGDVAPEEADEVLNKHTTSMFVGTHFEYMMRNRGIETLAFTGISTEIGIASSVRDSMNRGFYTLVIEDCVSSPNRELHEACLKILGTVSFVVSSEDLFRLWK